MEERTKRTSSRQVVTRPFVAQTEAKVTPTIMLTFKVYTRITSAPYIASSTPTISNS